MSTVDIQALRKALEGAIEGEVRFDPVTRALYSTDASVYQIDPAGVVLPRSRDDLVRVVGICARLRCPLTMRGGGTSQAGQAIGQGLIVDTSKYLNAVLELNAVERWVRVEPGIVLDELNAQLRPHDLRFAPDVSTASRATVGGMMANNSSGARSVLYGKTIDHVLEQEVVLSDGSVVEFRPLAPEELQALASRDTLEGACYRAVAQVVDQQRRRDRAPVSQGAAPRGRLQSRRVRGRSPSFQPCQADGGIRGNAWRRAVGQAESRTAAEGQSRPHHSVAQPGRIARPPRRSSSATRLRP